jgi:ribulose-phosphate 3-epimerase
MDGHYVPNFTVGVDFCKALYQYTSISLDIHLMIEDVDRYIPDFAQFEHAVMCFHPEVVYHPIRTLQVIKQHGRKAGIAIDPSMAVESIQHLLPYVDMICVMTVNPGYSGQELIPETLAKMAVLSDYIQEHNLDIDIEVDGNVSWENIPKMIQAGADTLVLGTSSLFQKGVALEDNLKKLRALVSQDDSSFED